jgi:hypothetical protein
MPDDNEDQNPEGQHGAHIFINPAALMQQQQAAMDHQAMAAQEFRVSVDRLLDELNPEQAFTLYRLMHSITHQGVEVASHFAGQLTYMLRVVHKICRGCGRADHTFNEHDILVMGAQATSQLMEPGILPVGGDDLSVPDGEDMFDDPDESPSNAEIEQDIEGVMAKYKVHPLFKFGDDSRTIGTVECDDCETEYLSLAVRTAEGLQCPVCKLREKLSNGETN